MCIRDRHKIVGGQRFNDRKEVKDIHSYMSIVANPRDDVRLRRIINEPARKIGATTVAVIADLAGQQGVSMLDVISHADQYAKLSRAVMPLLKFWQIYQRLQDSLATRTLDEFASDVIELTGYKAMLETDAAKGHEDAADRLQNLGQLVNNVKNYCDQHGEEATLEGYLEACRTNREESREESLWPNQSSSRKGAISVENQAAVSYTHLDVYKRQTYGFTCNGKRIKKKEFITNSTTD